MSIVEIKGDINQYLKKAGSSLAIIYFYVTWYFFFNEFLYLGVIIVHQCIIYIKV